MRLSLAVLFAAICGLFATSVLGGSTPAQAQKEGTSISRFVELTASLNDAFTGLLETSKDKANNAFNAILTQFVEDDAEKAKIIGLFKSAPDEEIHKAIADILRRKFKLPIAGMADTRIAASDSSQPPVPDEESSKKGVWWGGLSSYSWVLVLALVIFKLFF